MIERVTVDELYSLTGFSLMISEYAKHAIKRMPAPKYLKEDYLPMEKAGLLSVWAAMEGGEVVGFMSLIATKIPHYGVGVAIVESLFVRESCRKVGYGLRFFNIAMQHGLALGAPGVFFNCPFGSDFEKFLVAKGGSPETVSYFFPLPWFHRT